MKPAGLQTHIWNNNLKSIALLAVYPIILLAIIWTCVFALYDLSIIHDPLIQQVQQNNAPLNFMGLELTEKNYQAQRSSQLATNFLYEYWPAIIAIVAAWFIISYFFHTRMVAGMAHARPVTRAEEPELYNLLENLCISQGMNMPKFNVIETHALNAFASGLNENTYTVTVTRGLLNRLAKDEVEAVLAHELVHIINRDVRLMMIAIVFTGMIGLAAQLVWSNLRYSLFIPRRGDRNGGHIIIMLLISLILWIGYMATVLTRFALSRRREYMADAGAVEMTKNPEAMMRALMRISGRDRIPEATDDIAFMCIENTRPFLGIFATHPSIEKRLAAISISTSTDIPAILPVAAAEEQISNESQDERNPWLTRSRPFRKKDNPWVSDS